MVTWICGLAVSESLRQEFRSGEEGVKAVPSEVSEIWRRGDRRGGGRRGRFKGHRRGGVGDASMSLYSLAQHAALKLNELEPRCPPETPKKDA